MQGLARMAPYRQVTSVRHARPVDLVDPNRCRYLHLLMRSQWLLPDAGQHPEKLLQGAVFLKASFLL